jgi:tetratricopeptide (TPR) repeat protein
MFRWLLWLALLSLIASCAGKGVMRLRPAGENPAENIRIAIADTVPLPPPPHKDTLSDDALRILKEQYAGLTEYIIASLVNAQRRAYDERFREAEVLLLQTLQQQPTADALLLLGSIYEVQGQLSRADSCWQAAKELDADLHLRPTEMPKRETTERKDRPKK